MRRKEYRLTAFANCSQHAVHELLSSERIEILEKVYFGTNSDQIKEQSYQLLDSVAKVLSEHPEIEKIRILAGSANDTLNLATATATDAVTVEAWLTPASTALADPPPARIITCSDSPTTRNFTLGQFQFLGKRVDVW